MAPVEHLYLHIPFCAKICPYCSFYVRKGGRGAQEDFVRALILELEIAQTRYPLAPQTIYLGGGTPSLLGPDLFAQVATALPPHRPEEFTLEANPATVTPAKAAAWRAAGVNRISLGAQSFDPGYLKILGRQHAPEDIPATVTELRAAGFSNINIDLMFALPGQPLAAWQSTVEAALACAPDHLSCYGLTYEQDTPFFEKLQSGEWQPDEDGEIAMFLWTRERLEAAGLPGYEISNFARPGFESRHNRACWAGKDYLGFGPSATSTLAGRRWKNIPDVAAYTTRLHAGESIETEPEIITPEIHRQERILLGLRTREGLPMDTLESGRRDDLVRDGLLAITGDRVTLTARGRLLADSIAGMFV